LDKRTNLPANHFGSSSPFCPAACSGFEFTRPPPYSKLPSDAGQHQVCVRCRALGCMRIALQLFVRCVCMLVSRPPQFLRVRRLRTWCVRGLGAQRGRRWSRPGVWLCEDCPPAVRAVRVRTGFTTSARGAYEVPPHVCALEACVHEARNFGCCRACCCLRIALQLCARCVYAL
jgi:hypothetical protein